MTIFVQENRSGSDLSVRDKTGFCPDPRKNTVFYRKTISAPDKAIPVMLIDSETGNIDIRDAAGETLVSIDATSKNLKISGIDPLEKLEFLKSNAEKLQSNSENHGLAIASNTLEIKGVLHSIEAILLKLQKPSHPIGSVVQAFIGESEFQNQMGSGWMLCDGREVSGSSYHQLGLGSKIPDCRGLFLRSSGGSSSPLGTKQDQATAKNGLNISKTALSTYTGKPDFQVEWEFNDWDDSRSPDFSKGWKRISVVEDCQNVKSKVNVGSIESPSPTRFMDQSHSHDFDLNLSSTDQETRPDNISINTFIKIN